jgi:hypothetical protein
VPQERTYALLSRPPLVGGLPQPVLLCLLVSLGPALWLGWEAVAALVLLCLALRVCFEYERDIPCIVVNAIRHRATRRLS